MLVEEALYALDEALVPLSELAMCELGEASSANVRRQVRGRWPRLALPLVMPHFGGDCP
jgi:hypothetical protein